MTIRAAAYMRSEFTASKGKQVIDAQYREIIEYCAQKGFSLTNKYVDEGHTCIDPQRPNFVQLLLDVKEEKFDVIVVSAYDRFSRKHSDLERLRQTGVRLESVSI